MAREILAGLNPPSSWSSFDRVPGRGHAGGVSLACQVAAALAGDTWGAVVVYALHAGDARAMLLLRERLMGMARGSGADDALAGRLADAAIAELVHAHQCGRCAGTGLAIGAAGDAGALPGTRGYAVCPACDGSGLQRQSARGRALSCGVGRGPWTRRWGAIYDALYHWLAGRERSVRERIRRYLV